MFVASKILLFSKHQKYFYFVYTLLFFSLTQAIIYHKLHQSICIWKITINSKVCIMDMFHFAYFRRYPQGKKGKHQKYLGHHGASGIKGAKKCVPVQSLVLQINKSWFREKCKLLVRLCLYISVVKTPVLNVWLKKTCLYCLLPSVRPSLYMLIHM